MKSFFIAFENDEWCCGTYWLSSAYFILVRVFRFFLFLYCFFFLSIVLLFGFEVSLAIFKIKHWSCSQVPKWSSEGRIASALFSNCNCNCNCNCKCNWLDSVLQKFELHLTSTCLLELLAADYLHETNISVFISHKWLFVLQMP